MSNRVGTYLNRMVKEVFFEAEKGKVIIGRAHSLCKGPAVGHQAEETLQGL